ncbi:uncharacterized protein TRIREDRAFT_105483 [Trichoderma reesei QM6a]|uniref:Predicted protein n=2 Tax=Hypocrea jecorina TaxID=51453 RepID=G0RET1_HYPJQ|nr:uncharacterized protein TRIREDRAFT_105483 [Trichoderma reesei QM6a]EGR50175.1 predicted protein [Trichoderma reesei QM6a]ETS03849.1 hypothetical protein M419DRAFT_74838 [Trichoderma reesei RUT C-30]
MKSSAVILAACASLAGATPTYRSGNWNSTVVNWNSTTPTNWNTSSSSPTASWSSPTAITTSTTTGLPQAEAASLPPSSSLPPPYWSNGTTGAVSNETWVNHNQTRFSPGQAHQPVPLIRRFRPQRKTLSRAFLPNF